MKKYVYTTILFLFLGSFFCFTFHSGPHSMKQPVANAQKALKSSQNESVLIDRKSLEELNSFAIEKAREDRKIFNKNAFIVVILLCLLANFGLKILELMDKLDAKNEPIDIEEQENEKIKNS